MKIAVMGAGSMGSIIGALMTKGGLDTVLIDANVAHVRAMNERGMKIVGQIEDIIPVKAITPDAMQGLYDIVIFVPKATSNQVALKQLMPHIGPDSAVITLQNGINEDVVASKVGPKRACGGIILWGATWQAPGVSELTSVRDQMGIIIGEVDGKISDRIQRIKGALEKVCAVEVTDELMSHRWSKLFINTAFSGVGTVIGGDFGHVVDDDVAVRVAAFVGMETVQTAKSLDCAKVKFMFVDPDFLVFDTEEKLKKIVNFFRAALKAHRGIVPSMLQDIEKGRPCEVDVINGYVEKKARDAGVGTPVNDRVTEIIRDIERGKRRPSIENVKDIKLPVLK